MKFILLLCSFLFGFISFSQHDFYQEPQYEELVKNARKLNSKFYTDDTLVTFDLGKLSKGDLNAFEFNLVVKDLNGNEIVNEICSVGYIVILIDGDRDLKKLNNEIKFYAVINSSGLTPKNYSKTVLIDLHDGKRITLRLKWEVVDKA